MPTEELIGSYHFLLEIQGVINDNKIIVGGFKSVAGMDSETEIVEALASSLKASLEVERLPLGLDAPNLVVDLDAFAEAVSACVYTDDGDVEPFGVQHTAELRAQPPGGRASVYSEHAPPFKLKVASAALATLSAVSIFSSVTNRSRA